jgi:phosphoribosyl 1,2-cyclic phosphodiesterase
LKFASLGSGSEGNALLISATSGGVHTTVMLDCGFSIRETARRLAKLDMMPADLAGIIVTHEHQDHISGVFKFARRYDIPVWLSFGTHQAVQNKCTGVTFHVCRDGQTIVIGALDITPYTVPHDAREPIQYVVSNGVYKLGVLTDAGHATAHMIAALSGCDALVMECNHDSKMLADSTYPSSLKSRVGGPYGHLSNRTSAEIVAALDQSRLKIIVGAHLSQQNNTPQLAHAALSDALDCAATKIMIASQDEGFGWITVGQ